MVENVATTATTIPLMASTSLVLRRTRMGISNS
jgi:hypothetical protein